MPNRLIRCATPMGLALLTFVPLHGQTAVEAALAGGSAATMSAPAQSLGKALAGLIGGAGKSLQAAQSSANSSNASAVTVVSSDKMATPKNDGRTYEDPKLIPAGLAYEELVKRFGPPAMELTTAPGRQSVMFSGQSGSRMVELQDGKVLPAPKPPAAQQSAVIVLK